MGRAAAWSPPVLFVRPSRKPSGVSDSKVVVTFGADGGAAAERKVQPRAACARGRLPAAAERRSFERPLGARLRTCGRAELGALPDAPDQRAGAGGPGEGRADRREAPRREDG